MAARILVIDDDALMRLALASALEEEYEVSSASNGETGVQLAASFQPDLIICDVAMPRMDGFAVLRECRSIPAMRNVPFVFLSGKADEATIQQGMSLGASDFMAKPFSLADLHQLIKRRLGQKTNV